MFSIIVWKLEEALCDTFSYSPAGFSFSNVQRLSFQELLPSPSKLSKCEQLFYHVTFTNVSSSWPVYVRWSRESCRLPAAASVANCTHVLHSLRKSLLPSSSSSSFSMLFGGKHRLTLSPSANLCADFSSFYSSTWKAFRLVFRFHDDCFSLSLFFRTAVVMILIQCAVCIRHPFSLISQCVVHPDASGISPLPFTVLALSLWCLLCCATLPSFWLKSLKRTDKSSGSKKSRKWERKGKACDLSSCSSTVNPLSFSLIPFSSLSSFRFSILETFSLDTRLLRPELLFLPLHHCFHVCMCVYLCVSLFFALNSLSSLISSHFATEKPSSFTIISAQGFSQHASMCAKHIRCIFCCEWHTSLLPFISSKRITHIRPLVSLFLLSKTATD